MMKRHREDMPPGRARSWIVPVGVVICIMVWRFFVCPISAMWRDWILILTIYWIYTSSRSRCREWPIVTLSVLSYLLGIYILGQVRCIGVVFGILP